MPRVRIGFTLIELLIVVVIIGILASIAIPAVAQTKRKAYLTAMRSDLKGLVLSAEAYFADHNSYVGMPAPVGSPGVTIALGVLDATGWAASATHAAAPGATCVIGVGSQTPTGLGEGQPGGAGCR